MKTYNYFFKAKIIAKNDESAQRKAMDHIKNKYASTMKITTYDTEED